MIKTKTYYFVNKNVRKKYSKNQIIGMKCFDCDLFYMH